jgi:centromeric protein E
MCNHLVYLISFILRIRPTKSTCAWEKAGQTIKLHPDYSKSVTGTEYNFDEILTGSENKPVYNAVARSHVCAAMDGYNAVIFAYGQTASGKTFTLVSHSTFLQNTQ